MWGAVLGISLQARCVALAGSDSVAAYGHISVAGAIAAAVVQLIVGPISDRARRNGGRRLSFYIIGGIGGALAALAFYNASSIVALTIGFVALQAALNVAIGPYQAVLPDFVAAKQIGTGSGWMAASQSGGNAFGAILATALVNPAALGAVLAVVVIVSGAASVEYVRRLPLQPFIETHLRITRTLIDLFISRAFVYIGFYTLLGYFYFYLRNALPHEFPLSAQAAGGLGILLFTLVGALGAALAAKPSDRIDERLLVSVGGGLLAGAIGALAAGPALPLVVLAIAVAGVGWGIFLCADWAYACRILPTGSLATTMALWNLAVVAPQILAPLLATVLLARLGALTSALGPRIAFGLAGIEIIAGILWIWRLPPNQAWNKGSNPRFAGTK